MLIAVRELADASYSNRRIAQALRISRGRVADLLHGYTRPDCGCGRPANHSGWCVIKMQLRGDKSLFRHTEGGYRRTLRRPFRFGGAGGVGVDAVVIKAPPRTDKNKPQKPPEPKKPYSLLARLAPVRRSASVFVANHRARI
jgi:hypothetical protein